MNQIERPFTKANPFTTALAVGLGWGLLFGVVDGLHILLELPILPYLRPRLESLVYLAACYELAGAVLLGAPGLIAWALLRMLRREVKRRTLVGVYSGVSIGLAIFFAGLRGLAVSVGDLDDPGHAMITLAALVIAGGVGLAQGLGVYSVAIWWQGGRGFLRPLRWKVARAGVLGASLACIIVLLSVVAYRNYLYDLALFRPRPSGQVATHEQPNVILITIDTLRADHLGTYGYDPEISPNIDGLARRGVAFEQAITQSPWTVPSTASFITSLHPAELGICRKETTTTDMHVDRMRVTLAEIFQDAGYRTHGYAANPLISPKNWFDQGFDHFVDARDKFAFDLEEMEKRTLPGLVCQDSVEAPYARSLCKLFGLGHSQIAEPRLGWHGDRWITEYGVRFLRQHKNERFFLWLFYVGPHAAYDPPEPFRPLPDEISAGRERYLRTLTTWLRFGGEIIRPVDRQALVSLYDGEIVYTDSLVGQVLDELDRLGLADRTLVVLNADHGEEFADHGGYSHGHTLYDEQVHVPFIISGPGVEAAGRRVETQVRLLDLVPTVCEIAGVPTPEEAEGRSLVPFLRGEEMEELPAFSEALLRTVFEKKAIRHNGYKLVYDVRRETMELYDLRADFQEQVNLAKQEPETAEAMLADLDAWMVRSAQVATELPRERPLRQALDEEMRERLRDAGY
jgi:arylsulfatase A-like enzyme